MSLINRLRSSGLIVTLENKEKIISELQYLGFPKVNQLLSLEKDINDIVEMYRIDCKVATFFWRHIRRVETNFKAIIINYFEKEKNPQFVDNQKVNKEFAKNYLKYIDGNQKIDNKTYNVTKNVIRNLKKNHVNICEVISNLSLGHLIDLFDRFDEAKFHAYDEVLKYRELRKIIFLRNQIAHHHLLITQYSKQDLLDFWLTIKNQSLITEKTKTNEAELYEMLENVYNTNVVT